VGHDSGAGTILPATRCKAVVEARSRAEVVFVEPEPVDFSEAACAALRDSGFRVSRLKPDQRDYGGLLSIPVIVAGAAHIPAFVESLWRVLAAGGSPALALVSASDLERANWLGHAADVIVWPPASGELAFRIGRWSMARTQRAAGELQDLLNQAGIVGRSDTLLSALADLPAIARSGAPVLITGETGTGKDLIARAVHYGSERRRGPFVPINCGAIPENLFENEMFGHVKGAYTHAAGPQMGLIARADHGTLFLDEIDALSLRSQVTLLRFLQDGQYWPLGSSGSRTADVRVLAATNRTRRCTPLGHELCGQGSDCSRSVCRRSRLEACAILA